MTDRRTTLAALAALATARFSPAFAAAAPKGLPPAPANPGALGAPPVPGKEYTQLEPARPPIESSDRIEVLEFFYYGCPHCYNLQPTLDAWVKVMPKDVAFRRVPTVFRESHLPLTRTFYALEAMGALEKAHGNVFFAIHQGSVNLSVKKVLLTWAEKNGIDPKKLDEAYESFGVNTRTQRAVQLTRSYNIEGTPTVVIGGRYVTAPHMTVVGNDVDYARLTQVMNGLVAMARKARKG